MRKMISIVVPCRNEERRLSRKRLASFLDSIERLAGIRAEMVLEEDGSNDGTPALVDRIAKSDPRIRAVHGKGRLGKGGGLALGVMKSRGGFILMSDADFPVCARDAAGMVAMLEENDLVVPSRRLPGAKTSGIPVMRRIASRAYSAYANLLLGIGISDTQIGVKAFRKRAFAKIRPSKFTSYSMDVEMLVRARRANLRITEVPVEYAHAEDTGFSCLRDGPRMLLDVILIRLFL